MTRRRGIFAIGCYWSLLVAIGRCSDSGFSNTCVNGVNAANHSNMCMNGVNAAKHNNKYKTAIAERGKGQAMKRRRRNEEREKKQNWGGERMKQRVARLSFSPNWKKEMKKGTCINGERRIIPSFLHEKNHGKRLTLIDGISRLIEKSSVVRGIHLEAVGPYDPDPCHGIS